MCRHLAYLGSPVRIGALLIDAPHSLRRQAYAPRLMHWGHENHDGWGVAWYEPDRAEPMHYRTVVSLQHDRGFAAAGQVASSLLAAVRLASPGLALERDNTAPFVRGSIAFSLNGYGFADGREPRLRAALPRARAEQLEGDTDTEVLFALVLERLESGLAANEALRDVTTLAEPDGSVRLNLLLTDGNRITATTWGNSLFTRSSGPAVVVASEPLDDEPGWTRVPDRSLVDAAPGTVTITSLEMSSR